MKVYIAAKYHRRFELRKVAELLQNNGIEVTSQWLYNGEESKGQTEAALMDLADVDRADAVLFFAEPKGSMNTGGGRYVEFGYAYAKGKPIFAVAPSGEHETVFGALPDITTVFTEYSATRELLKFKGSDRFKSKGA